MNTETSEKNSYEELFSICTPIISFHYCLQFWPLLLLISTTTTSTKFLHTSQQLSFRLKEGNTKITILNSIKGSRATCQLKTRNKLRSSKSSNNLCFKKQIRTKSFQSI